MKSSGEGDGLLSLRFVGQSPCFEGLLPLKRTYTEPVEGRV